MTILEFLKSIYRVLIARFNSTPNDNSTPDGNSRLPSQKPQTELLLSYYDRLSRRWPPIVPPSWDQAGSSPVLGRVVFIFAQDIDELRNETPLDQMSGWTAQLDLFTCDLPSLLRNGLFLTCENVKEQENYVKHSHMEGVGLWYNRCYTVTNSTWSGNLNVCARTVKPIANFRLHHLSPDNVFVATAANHESNSVYSYGVRYPDYKANFMYDDMPLDGLWPWPKKEGEMKGEEVKEDEEVAKGEVESDEGGDTAWEEEEMDSFSTWGSEDPLIDSWRD